MTDPAIIVNDVSKQYKISAAHQHVDTLRDQITEGVRRIFQRKNGKTPAMDTIWALRDVSFDVKQGEALGVVGANGSGKSTLLKILSRITKPTLGYTRTQGRVGSLLEVGTGFHNELSGRENIYLNASILNMSRRDIERKFDEIVDFAGVEKFIDTPVKRYSSGMYLRLAFSVAAHIDTEILLVDEVLAVGDLDFQKKCLGLMGDISKQGRTVLFVSHNLAAIRQLCHRAILLNKGELVSEGNVDKVLNDYVLTYGERSGAVNLTSYHARRGSGQVTFEWVRVSDTSGEVTTDFSVGDDVVFSFGLKTPAYPPDTKLIVQVSTSDGLPVLHLVNVDSGFKLMPTAEDEQQVSVHIEDIRLYPGGYNVSLKAVSGISEETLDFVPNCLGFNIIDGGNLTMRPLPRRDGLIFLVPKWSQQT